MTKETEIARRIRKKLYNLNNAVVEARKADHEIELTIGRCNPDGDVYNMRIRNPNHPENGLNKPTEISTESATEDLQRWVTRLNKEIKLVMAQPHLGIDLKLRVIEDYQYEQFVIAVIPKRHSMRDEDDE